MDVRFLGGPGSPAKITEAGGFRCKEAFFEVSGNAVTDLTTARLRTWMYGGWVLAARRRGVPAARGSPGGRRKRRCTAESGPAVRSSCTLHLPRSAWTARSGWRSRRSAGPPGRLARAVNRDAGVIVLLGSDPAGGGSFLHDQKETHP